MNDIILYTTEDGKSQINLRTDEHTVWLTQREMSELFDVSVDNIGLHLKNIYRDGELVRETTAEESSVVQIEGARAVQRPLTLYNLDAILAVGYRVRSPRGVQFRRWDSTVLKEYLLKGFAMDDERLKNPDGRPDHQPRTTYKLEPHSRSKHNKLNHWLWRSKEEVKHHEQ